MKPRVVALALLLLACKKAPPASGDPSHPSIVADDKGFTPSSVTLPAGKPAAITFTRTTDSTCATEVVFAETGVKKELPLNVPVTVDVPTDQTRTLSFACGMGMFKGSVVVSASDKK